MKDKKGKRTSYAGRWVAKLGGEVIAQGGTPGQALRLAQSIRHKEKPVISYMPPEIQVHPLVEKVKALLTPDQEIYLVGGGVRDMLLQRGSPDLDFALPADAISFARRVANKLKADYFTLDEARDIGRVIVTDEPGKRTFLDFNRFQGGQDIEQDLKGRDFTINALAYDLRNGSMLDPLGGVRDLQAKKIRACSADSFKRDPVRILRAVRFAAALAFQIDPETRRWAKTSADKLQQTSPERLRDELFKILDGPQPDACLRALEILGVLPYFLPELTRLKGEAQPAPHVHDVWDHTLAVLRYLEALVSALHVGYDADQTNDLFTGLVSLKLGRYREQLAAHFANSLNPERSIHELLFFAALVHDVAKPQSRSVDENGRMRFLGHAEAGARIAVECADRLHLSRDEQERLDVIIRNHMRFHYHVSRMEAESRPPSRRAIYRFFRDAGAAGVDLVLLGLADRRGTQDTSLTQETWSAALSVARLLLENYWEKPQESISPPKLLDGNELMAELKLEPGEQLGRLLEAIREAQAVGKVVTRDQAIIFSRDWLRDEHQSATR